MLDSVKLHMKCPPICWVFVKVDTKVTTVHRHLDLPNRKPVRTPKDHPCLWRCHVQKSADRSRSWVSHCLLDIPNFILASLLTPRHPASAAGKEAQQPQPKASSPQVPLDPFRYQLPSACCMEKPQLAQEEGSQFRQDWNITANNIATCLALPPAKSYIT